MEASFHCCSNIEKHMKSKNFSFSWNLFKIKLLRCSLAVLNVFVILGNEHSHIHLIWAEKNISNLVNGIFSKYWLQLNDITIERYTLRVWLNENISTRIQQKLKLYRRTQNHIIICLIRTEIWSINIISNWI